MDRQETNDALKWSGPKELRGFTTNEYELVISVKHWAEYALRLRYFSFLYGQFGSDDLPPYASRKSKACWAWRPPRAPIRKRSKPTEADAIRGIGNIYERKGGAVGEPSAREQPAGLGADRMMDTNSVCTSCAVRCLK